MELILVSLGLMLARVGASAAVEGLISNLQVPACAEFLRAGLQLAGETLPAVMDILLVSLDVSTLSELLPTHATLILSHSDMYRALMALKDSHVSDMVASSARPLQQNERQSLTRRFPCCPNHLPHPGYLHGYDWELVIGARRIKARVGNERKVSLPCESCGESGDASSARILSRNLGSHRHAS